MWERNGNVRTSAEEIQQRNDPEQIALNAGGRNDRETPMIRQHGFGRLKRDLSESVRPVDYSGRRILNDRERWDQQRQIGVGLA
jgi:hypothetical protein